MSDTRRDPAAAALEYLALGLLMPGAQHGYTLYQDYVAAFAPIWKVGRSQFYAALADLHATGELQAQTEWQEEHPPRKVYAITEAGRARFLAWVYQPVTPMRAVRVEFLAKLRFFTRLGLPDAARLIDAQIAACQAAADAWEQRKAGQGSEEGDPFLHLVYDFRQQQAAFMAGWLETCRSQFVAERKS